MRIANIAELKNRLSHYLEDVRRGEEVLIRDRNKPIAEIVPLDGSEDFDSQETALATEGLIKLPSRKLPRSFWRMKAPEISTSAVAKAVGDERDEG